MRLVQIMRPMPNTLKIMRNDRKLCDFFLNQIIVFIYLLKFKKFNMLIEFSDKFCLLLAKILLYAEKLRSTSTPEIGNQI